MINNFFNETKKFYKEHEEQIKMGLLVVGTSVCAFALGYFIGNTSKGNDVGIQLDTIHSKETFSSENLLEPIERIVKEVNVPGYIRALPEGYHASPAKIAEAAERGIELTENQTLVDPYNYDKTYIV